MSVSTAIPLLTDEVTDVQAGTIASVSKANRMGMSRFIGIRTFRERAEYHDETRGRMQPDSAWQSEVD